MLPPIFDVLCNRLFLFCHFSKTPFSAKCVNLKNRRKRNTESRRSSGECWSVYPSGKETSVSGKADSRCAERHGTSCICSCTGQFQWSKDTRCGHQLQLYRHTPRQFTLWHYKRKGGMITHATSPKTLYCFIEPRPSMVVFYINSS